MDYKDFLLNDRFAVSNGCKIISLQSESATLEMEVTDRHLNAGNVCQGGAIFMLCDLAFAAAVNGCGRLTLSLAADISFHNPAKQGDILTAVARVVSDHPKVPYCCVEVKNQDGLLIASFSSQGYRKNASWRELQAKHPVDTNNI